MWIAESNKTLLRFALAALDQPSQNDFGAAARVNGVDAAKGHKRNFSLKLIYKGPSFTNKFVEL